jgi:predicted hotdog family 3-hydroxylacyl-ACP dehydratase
MLKYPPIETLLPHRAPMILLDEVHADATGSITCKVTLRAHSPFVENRRVPAVVAVEYMAQCVAAYAGLQAFRQGRPVRIGYVIGARLVEFSVDEFDVGEELVAKASRIWGDDALGKFECSVDSRERRVAAAILTVFQGDINDVAIGRAAKS